MIIAIVLAIVAVCASVVYLNLKTASAEKKLIELDAERVKLETIMRAHDMRIDDITKDIDEIDDQIEAILKVLEDITADIHRIDHDEKDIRKYYMYYREPSHPNGGVQWSEEIKASEDAIDG